MKTRDFDYYLPEELIAQHPTKKRDDARLLCSDRALENIMHAHFYDIVDRLRKGDVLVLNDTRVLPARLYAHKEKTDAKIEIFLVKKNNYFAGEEDFPFRERWQVLMKPSKRVKPGDTLVFKTEDEVDTTWHIKVPECDNKRTGIERVVDFYSEVLVREQIIKYDVMPLPPYIKRIATDIDSNDYQTVFARNDGAIAAPTAGLHFNETLLKKIKDKGVKICYVTLHVGYGTFKPIEVENLEEHTMHTEQFEISKETADTVSNAKKENHRIVACGTTVVRALESAAKDKKTVSVGSAETNIFIYPSYEFKIVDALITNFHLPKSSLFMLVCAFATTQQMKDMYAEAVKEKYRFFSYGDAMFIE